MITDLLHSHKETAIWINQNPLETRIVFNNFLNSYLGQSLSDDVVDIALSNIVISADPLSNSVYSFAEKANALGYLGRNGYNLSEIFYPFDSNSMLEGKP